MQSRRVIAALAVAAVGAALAAPSGAAGAPSCVGQVGSAPNAYPTEVADFITFFAGPGFGQNVAGFARADRSDCPPLPTPGA
jgi:hypothetical protein